MCARRHEIVGLYSRRGGHCHVRPSLSFITLPQRMASSLRFSAMPTEGNFPPRFWSRVTTRSSWLLVGVLSTSVRARVLARERDYRSSTRRTLWAVVTVDHEILLRVHAARYLCVPRNAAKRSHVGGIVAIKHACTAYKLRLRVLASAARWRAASDAKIHGTTLILRWLFGVVVTRLSRSTRLTYAEPGEYLGGWPCPGSTPGGGTSFR